MIPGLNASYSNEATAVNDGIQTIGGGVYINPTVPASSNNSTVPSAQPFVEGINNQTLLIIVAVIAGIVFLKR